MCNYSKLFSLKYTHLLRYLYFRKIFSVGTTHSLCPNAIFFSSSMLMDKFTNYSFFLKYLCILKSLIFYVFIFFLFLQTVFLNFKIKHFSACYQNLYQSGQFQFYVCLTCHRRPPRLSPFPLKPFFLEKGPLLVTEFFFFC